MIVANLIDWQPIEDIPENRQDGRLMLLWSEAGGVQLGYWQDGEWVSDLVRQQGGDTLNNPAFVKEEFLKIRYWADINPPE